MATDLNTLLKTKKVDEQFTQYFIYQLMVWKTINTPQHATHKPTQLLTLASVV
jgi:hypothetical protein